MGFGGRSGRLWRACPRPWVHKQAGFGAGELLRLQSGIRWTEEKMDNEKFLWNRLISEEFWLEMYILFDGTILRLLIIFIQISETIVKVILGIVFSEKFGGISKMA